MKLEHHLGKLAERHGKALAAATAPVSLIQIRNFTGTWVNELKSTMILQQSNFQAAVPTTFQPPSVVTAQALAGTYTSTSTSYTPSFGPVYGFVSGTLISFAVTWFNSSARSLMSNAAWEGYATAFDNAGNPTAFTTNWQLTYIDEKGNFVVETGNDEFKKTS
jgi:hypothetical protein